MAEAATTPAGMQKLILEKLVGATGATDKVMGASRSLAIRAVPLVAKNLNEGLTDPVDFTLKTVEVARIADIRPAPGGYHAMTIAPSAVSADALTLSPDAAFAAVMEGRTVLDLAEGLQLRRVRVMGACRIELSGFNDTMRDRLRAYGLFGEIISWKLRMFVPTDASGVGILTKVLDTYPVARVGEREAA